MTCPCYKCEDRQHLCHSECERYAEFKAALDTARIARNRYEHPRTYLIDNYHKVAKKMRLWR